MRAALAVVLLAGCTTAPPVVPDVVRVPVPVACLKPADIPPAPVIATSAALRAMDPFDRYRTIAAERAELLAWHLEALPILQSCAKP